MQGTEALYRNLKTKHFMRKMSKNKCLKTLAILQIMNIIENIRGRQDVKNAEKLDNKKEL